MVLISTVCVPRKSKPPVLRAIILAGLLVFPLFMNEKKRETGGKRGKRGKISQQLFFLIRKFNRVQNKTGPTFGNYMNGNQEKAKSGKSRYLGKKTIFDNNGP